MDINQAFPSKWLSEPDLFGQNVVLTMARVSMEDIGRGEVKPILWFSDHEKGMVMNITNANMIGSIYGSETNNWTGQIIELYPTTTDFQGKIVPCIRVRQAHSAPAPHPVQHPPVQPAQVSGAPAQTPQQQGNASQAPAAPGYQTDDPLNYDV